MKRKTVHGRVSEEKVRAECRKREKKNALYSNRMISWGIVDALLIHRYTPSIIRTKKNQMRLAM